MERRDGRPRSPRWRKQRPKAVLVWQVSGGNVDGAVDADKDTADVTVRQNLLGITRGEIVGFFVRRREFRNYRRCNGEHCKQRRRVQGACNCWRDCKGFAGWGARNASSEVLAEDAGVATTETPVPNKTETARKVAANSTTAELTTTAVNEERRRFAGKGARESSDTPMQDVSVTIKRVQWKPPGTSTWPKQSTCRGRKNVGWFAGEGQQGYRKVLGGVGGFRCCDTNGGNKGGRRKAQNC